MNYYMSYSFYIVAVGCEHTGYKSLMAGLVTEWIYDAFAVWSFFYILYLLNKLYELTNLVLTLFSMYFQVLSNGTLLEVLAGHGMVIEDSGY